MRSAATTLRRSLPTALLFVIFVTPAVHSQVNLGAFGGVDMTNLSGDAPSKTKYRSETGFAVGVVGEFRVASDVWLSLQPTWLQRGTKIAFAVEGEEEAVDSLKVAADYLTVPLVVKIVAGHGKTYVSGGLDLGFLLNATLSGAGENQDVSHTFRPIDLSAIFAFGVMLPIGRPRLTIELRYSQSIINAASSEQDPEVYSLPPRFRWAGLQLFAGFLYPLGGGGS
jgi:hypothetical protein